MFFCIVCIACSLVDASILFTQSGGFPQTLPRLLRNSQRHLANFLRLSALKLTLPRLLRNSLATSRKLYAAFRNMPYWYFKCVAWSLDPCRPAMLHQGCPRRWHPTTPSAILAAFRVIGRLSAIDRGFPHTNLRLLRTFVTASRAELCS